MYACWTCLAFSVEPKIVHGSRRRSAEDGFGIAINIPLGASNLICCGGLMVNRPGLATLQMYLPERLDIQSDQHISNATNLLPTPMSIAIQCDQQCNALEQLPSGDTSRAQTRTPPVSGTCRSKCKASTVQNFSLERVPGNLDVGFAANSSASAIFVGQAQPPPHRSVSIGLDDTYGNLRHLLAPRMRPYHCSISRNVRHTTKIRRSNHSHAPVV